MPGRYIYCARQPLDGLIKVSLCLIRLGYGGSCLALDRRYGRLLPCKLCPYLGDCLPMHVNRLVQLIQDRFLHLEHRIHIVDVIGGLPERSNLLL